MTLPDRLGSPNNRGGAMMTRSGLATPAHVTAQAAAQVEDRAVVRRPIPLGALNRSLDFARTELFFGTAKPDGAVTEYEFPSDRPGGRGGRAVRPPDRGLQCVTHA